MRITYLRPEPLPPLVKEYVLPPSSRTNVWVDLEEFPPGSGNTALDATDANGTTYVKEITTQAPQLKDGATWRAVYQLPGSSGAPVGDSTTTASPAWTRSPKRNASACIEPFVTSTCSTATPCCSAIHSRNGT